MNTNIGQRYATAHAAHYVDKDLGHALMLYNAIIETAPEAPEAEYCRIQLHNIANRVVPKPELLAAAMKLARAHLQLAPLDEQAPWPGTEIALGADAPADAHRTP